MFTTTTIVYHLDQLVVSCSAFSFSILMFSIYENERIGITFYFKEIILANSRYAPETPAGISRKKEIPV